MKRDKADVSEQEALHKQISELERAREEAEDELEEWLDGVLSDDDFQWGDLRDDYEADEMDNAESDGEEGEDSTAVVEKNTRSVKDEAGREEEPAHCHFTNVSVEALRNESVAKKEFPNILKATSRTEVWVEAGQMLYLPAGWFHEVTSFSTGESEDSSTHIALNFWFHPPTTQEFEQPYEDGYWEHWWKGRLEHHSSVAVVEPDTKKRRTA